MQLLKATTLFTSLAVISSFFSQVTAVPDAAAEPVDPKEIIERIAGVFDPRTYRNSARDAKIDCVRDEGSTKCRIPDEIHEKREAALNGYAHTLYGAPEVTAFAPAVAYTYTGYTGMVTVTPTVAQDDSAAQTPTGSATRPAKPKYTGPMAANSNYTSPNWQKGGADKSTDFNYAYMSATALMTVLLTVFAW